MPQMTEREWRAFANRKNLDPETGQKLADEAPVYRSKTKLELDEWWEQH